MSSPMRTHSSFTKGISLAALVAATMIANPATATAESWNHTGWYVGASTGLMFQGSMMEGAASERIDDTLPAGPDNQYTSPFNLKINKLTGVSGLSGGYNWHKSTYKIALEVAATVNYGEATKRIPARSLGTFIVPEDAVARTEDIEKGVPFFDWLWKLKKEYTISTTVKPGVYFADNRAAVYGILGVSYSAFKFSAIIDPDINDVDTYDKTSEKYRALGLKVGVGAEYHFTPCVSGFIEYHVEKYKSLDFKKHTFEAVATLSGTIRPNYQMVMAGIRYQF